VTTGTDIERPSSERSPALGSTPRTGQEASEAFGRGDVPAVVALVDDGSWPRAGRLSRVAPGLRISRPPPGTSSPASCLRRRRRR
jgi:hypothetical protein